MVHLDQTISMLSWNDSQTVIWLDDQSPHSECENSTHNSNYSVFCDRLVHAEYGV